MQIKPSENIDLFGLDSFFNEIINLYNKKKLISYDMGPANALIDDWSWLKWRQKLNDNVFCGCKIYLIELGFDLPLFTS